MERDLAVFGYIFAMENFNSHAHVERDCVFYRESTIDSDFNSHAHVERDTWDDVTQASILISTHTLTWSVTI